MRKPMFALLVIGGCAASEPVIDDGPISYEEFLDKAQFDNKTGTYIMNGDELVESEEQMRGLYDGYLQSYADLQRAEDGFGTSRQGLIVNRVGGQDDKWDATTAARLTYCVSKATFGQHYQTMISAMHDATRQWERVGNYNFIRLIAKDDNCTNQTTGIVFNVRLVSGQPFLARAFFPSTARNNREILVDSSSFGQIDPFTIRGILRHELGHTLGFRHEHTRPESGTCFEDNNWRALTAYDGASVMHYPQCNGTNDGNLRLTQRDKDGAAALYPGGSFQVGGGFEVNDDEPGEVAN